MSKYCVIGKSLPHTLSPGIHSALGCENYGVLELADEDALARFVSGGEYDGYNVTIPYKRTIMPMLGELSEGAREAGAVNTVVREGGILKGYNTDVDGLSYGLRAAGIDVCGRHVLVLGSGGTCNTAKYLCLRDGARQMSVVSRSGELNYSNCYELGDVEVVINTTPVGMMPHAYETPIDVSRFKKLEGVFDCIYNPLETLLVKQARANGINAANGLNMLVEQARVAHNLFQRAKGLPEKDEAVTECVARKIFTERRNIVLIGMAGSGKSAIGRSLAKKLGRKFVDTDAEAERREGKSIPQIFAEKGEEYFRAVERECVEEACSGLGTVIATGGGAALDEKNLFFMRSSGLCVLILRDIGKLATDGRPLSSDAESARKLFEARKKFYYAAADAEIDNNRTIDDAVYDILKITGDEI